MKCRLCLQERDLRDSHIIPEFLYRPGYDEKGRMLALEKNNKRPRYIQKGLREKLLCDSCEGLLSKQYENYFSKYWYLKRTLPSSTTSEYLSLDNIDYQRFKLFHLSVLWRASVSSLDPFQMVDLGIHQETIRQMLLNGDPKQPSEYQVFGAVVLSPDTTKVLDGFVVSPTFQITNGLKIYAFVFGGCIWHYVEGNQPFEAMLPISLTSDGKLKLPVRDLRVIKPITLFFEDYRGSL